MTTVSSKIRDAFLAKMEECMRVCQSKTTKTLPSIELRWRQSGLRAGEALYNQLTGEAYVSFNPDYLTNHYDEMLNQVVPHEIAHVIANFLFGRCSHGFQWRIVMSWLGRPAERCHVFSTEGVKLKKISRPFKYICGCKDPQWLTLRLHTKIQELGKKYTCRRCKRRIVYYRQVGKVATPAPIQMILPPAPVVVPKVEVKTEPTYKLVTKLINGVLTNVQVPI